MRAVKAIRLRLGVTQEAMAEAIGCTQPNIGYYERGQGITPDMAKRLIEYAKTFGLVLDFNHIYGGAPLPEMPRKQLAEA